MDFLKELDQNQNLVLEMEMGFHKADVLRANKLFSGKFNKITYVTSTKPFSSQKAELEKEGIDISKYQFIDCVSKKAGLGKDEGETIFIDSPRSLTDIAIAISKIIKEGNVDLIFFDSVSSLLVYNTELSVVKFLHYLMVLFKGSKTKGVFVIMKNDLSRKVVREIELFADVITWLE